MFNLKLSITPNLSPLIGCRLDMVVGSPPDFSQPAMNDGALKRFCIPLLNNNNSDRRLHGRNRLSSTPAIYETISAGTKVN